MADEEIIGILRQCEVFASLALEDLTDVAAVCRNVRRAQRESLFREGDPPDSLYVIADGRIKILKHSSNGKELIVGFFGKGEMVGEVAAFEDRPYPASAEVVGEAHLLRIERADFVALVSRRPAIALRVMTVLNDRLRVAHDRLRDSTTERATQRIARLLLMLSRRIGPVLPFSREELGQMTGLTTETVIRELGVFASAGVVRSGRRKLVVVDPQGLVDLSETDIFPLSPPADLSS